MSYLTSGEGGEVIKFASVSATDDGANTVIAAVAGKKLMVVGYLLNGSQAGTATLQDNAQSPGVVATIKFTANQLFCTYAGGQEAPAFEVPVGLAFVISNSAGLDTTGHIAYMEI